MTVHGLSCDRMVIYLSERNPLTFLTGGHLQISKTLKRDQNLDFRRFIPWSVLSLTVLFTSFHKGHKSRSVFVLLFNFHFHYSIDLVGRVLGKLGPGRLGPECFLAANWAPANRAPANWAPAEYIQYQYINWTDIYSPIYCIGCILLDIHYRIYTIGYILYYIYWYWIYSANNWGIYVNWRAQGWLMYIF